MPHPAGPGDVNARLDRDDLADLEIRRAETRVLVNFQSQTVPGAVENPPPASVPDLGGISAFGKKPLIASWISWPDAPGFIAFKACSCPFRHVSQSFFCASVALPANDRACHVAEIPSNT